MRLCRFFGTDPQFWMNLQSAYDLLTAGREIGGEIERDVMPMGTSNIERPTSNVE